MKPFTKYLGTLSLLIIMNACGSSNPEPTPKTKSLGYFKKAQTCEQVRDYVHQQADTFRQQIEDGQYEHPSADPSIVMEDGFSASPTEMAGGDTGGSTGAVDENGGNGSQNNLPPEVVQSDIAYPDANRNLLYTLNQNQQLKIFQTSLEGSKLLTSLSLDFQGRELVSLSANSKEYLAIFGEKTSESQQEIWYQHSETVFALIDVTDPEQAQIIRQESHAGNFFEARAITTKNLIVWVTNRSLPLYDEQLTDPVIFTERQETNNGETNTKATVPCTDQLLYQNDSDAYQVNSELIATEIFVLDLNQSTLPIESHSILSPSYDRVVSVNPEHLFLAQTLHGNGPETELFQFDLSPLAAQASTMVPGNIPHQFAIHENLKTGIISVFHHHWDNSNICFDCVEMGIAIDPAMDFQAQTDVSPALLTGNYLTTFNPKLEMVDRSEAFATDQNLYGTRFGRNFGFAITFRQTDPLHSFLIHDGSQQPAGTIEKLGLLELPGYSAHLEILNDELILGIGEGGESEIVANLFDVSDPKNPTLANQLSLSQSWAYSEILGFEYRSLAIDISGRQFALPLNEEAYTKIKVFEVDLENKTLSLVHSIDKNILDFENHYRRAYWFGDTLATLSNEVEVYWQNDWNEIFSAPLE